MRGFAWYSCYGGINDLVAVIGSVWQREYGWFCRGNVAKLTKKPLKWDVKRCVLISSGSQSIHTNCKSYSTHDCCLMQQQLWSVKFFPSFLFNTLPKSHPVANRTATIVSPIPPNCPFSSHSTIPPTNVKNYINTTHTLLTLAMIIPQHHVIPTTSLNTNNILN